jgi:hypothetical protein
MGTNIELIGPNSFIKMWYDGDRKFASPRKEKGIGSAVFTYAE